MKRDISDATDIKNLVQTFFEKLMQVPVFNELFIEKLDIDMLALIDRYIAFWNRAIFQSNKTPFDILESHADVNYNLGYTLNASHFNEWLRVFEEVIRELYSGPNAQKAIEVARSMTIVIKMHIDDMEIHRKTLNN